MVNTICSLPSSLPEKLPDTASCTRACLKNHSSNLHAPICGIFCLHSVDVARYAALIQAKSPTNCNAHLAESIFQTRSSIPYFQMTFYRLFFYTIKFSVIMCFSMILSSYLVPRSLLLLRLCCVFFFKPFILNCKHLLFIKYCVLTRPFIITNPSASV